MNLIIHKHFGNIDEVQIEMGRNANNGDKTIAYISGDNDIINILKELIKTEYKTS